MNAHRQREEHRHGEDEQRGVVAALWPEEGYGTILADSGKELHFTSEDITGSDLASEAAL